MTLVNYADVVHALSHLVWMPSRPGAVEQIETGRIESTARIGRLANNRSPEDPSRRTIGTYGDPAMRARDAF
jgi:hypothetical protein